MNRSYLVGATAIACFYLSCLQAVAEDAVCRFKDVDEVRNATVRNLSNLISPNDIVTAIPELNGCPATLRDDERVRECLVPIENFQHLDNPNRDHGQRTITNGELPSALVTSKDLADLQQTSRHTQEQIDALIQATLKTLPDGSQAIQYKSGATSRRGWIFTIPEENRMVIAHVDLHLAGKPTDKPDLLIVSVERPKNAIEPIGYERRPYEFFVVNEGATTKISVKHECSSGFDCRFCHREGLVPPTSGDASAVRTFSLGKSQSPGTGMADFQRLVTEIRRTRPEGQDCSAWRGPELGSARRTAASRTDKAINACASAEKVELSVDDRSKVKEAMNCFGCHAKSDALDSIRWPFQPTHFSGDILKHYVLHGNMPPGADDLSKPAYLKPELRKVVYDCLMSEYFGGFSKMTTNPEPGLLLKSYLNNCSELASPIRSNTNPATPANHVPVQSHEGTH